MPCVAGFVTREASSPQTTFYPCRRRRRQTPNPLCALRRLVKPVVNGPTYNTVRLANPVQ